MWYWYRDMQILYVYAETWSITDRWEKGDVKNYLGTNGYKKKLYTLYKPIPYKVKCQKLFNKLKKIRIKCEDYFYDPRVWVMFLNQIQKHAIHEGKVR